MPEYIPDGNQNFLGGQDASKDPSKITPQSFAAGVNLNIQNDVLGPRWGYSKQLLVFVTPGGVVQSDLSVRSYENIFRAGRFQALIPYFVGSTFYLLVVVSGIIYGINLDVNEVFVIPISDGSMLDEGSPRINWSAASKFIVLFDYPARPVIIDGFIAHRADPALYEVPISVLGAYNQNRLFISNAGNEFTGGDPTGSLATPEAPVTFAEVEQSGAAFFGQIFQLPTSYNNNNITAMTFLQQVDISTGIGPLLIATSKELYAYNTQNPRVTWEQGQFGSLILFNAGIVGPRALVNLNSDLFFTSNDGEVRALSMSRNEQGKWSKTPISREVKNWLQGADPELLPYTVQGYFRNKIFVTANPFRVYGNDTQGNIITDVAFGGFVVLELDSVSTLSEPAPPAWAGLWTGIRPMEMCINNDRCFVMSKDDEVNELYEVTPEQNYDIIDGRIRQVKSTFYSRALQFQSPALNKEIHTILLGLQNVQGDFKLDLAYKPKQSFDYIPWRTFEHKAPWRACDMPEGCEFNGFAPHQFREVNLGSPDDAQQCNPVTNDNASIFKEMQLRMIIKGINWEIRDFTVLALGKPENTTQSICEPYPKVVVCDVCNEDWNIEGINLCQTLET